MPFLLLALFYFRFERISRNKRIVFNRSPSALAAAFLPTELEK